MLKRFTFLVIFFAACFSLFFAACGEDETPVAEQERTELRERINATIDTVDDRINTLQARLENATDDTRGEIEEQIRELQEYRVDLNQRLERIGNVSEDEWSAFRTETGETVDKVERRIQEIGE